jgi:hypothetical protein
MPNGHGGARPGAGRKPTTVKLEHADAATALLTAAVYELAIGQSSVELSMDSKGTIRPTVKVYGRDARSADKMARELFDGLVKDYCKPADGK